VAIEAFGKKVASPVLHLPILLDFWLIGGLGLGGILLAAARRRHRIGVIYAAAVVMLYCASIVVFYILARFRVPLLPVLCVFGGYTLVTMHARFRERDGDRRKRIVDALLTAAAFMVVAIGFDNYRYGWESQVMKMIRPDGTIVKLADRTLIKDNGPLSFGGWTPVPLDKDMTIVKTLAVSPVASSGATVRLAVSAERGGHVTIAGKSRPVTAGLNWLEIPASEFHPDASGAQLALSVQAQKSSSPAYLFIDGQRQYGRTTIGDQPAEGELVLELHVHKRP
jgi:hypothetical protein